MLQSLLVVFVLSWLAGAAPLFIRRSDRLLHLFIAFATGIFLGTVFLHLLPHVGELAAHAAEADPGAAARVEHAAAELHDHAGGHGAHAATLWGCVLLAVLALYLLEQLVIAGPEGAERERHLAVGYASLFGLAVHSFTAGLGWGAAEAAGETALAGTLYLSILGHKAAESFSLSSVFLLAGFRRRRLLVLLTLFSAATPAGMVLGARLVPSLTGWGIGVFTALAAGTFLFVALCDLLPEVFHHRSDAPAKVALLGLGVAASWVGPWLSA